MIFDDFDNAMEANEIVNSDRDEYNEFLDATGDDVSEFDDEPDYLPSDQWTSNLRDEKFDDSMDGDHDSAMRDAGWGTDEDYGYYGDSDLGGEY